MRVKHAQRKGNKRNVETSKKETTTDENLSGEARVTGIRILCCVECLKEYGQTNRTGVGGPTHIHGGYCADCERKLKVEAEQKKTRSEEERRWSERKSDIPKSRHR